MGDFADTIKIMDHKLETSLDYPGRPNGITWVREMQQEMLENSKHERDSIPYC